MGNKKTGKKSHKLLKILLCLLLVIVAAIAALAIWQMDNINAVITARSTSQEDIAQQISTSKANTQKEIEKYNIPIARDFTLEEEMEIQNGTLSVEEAVKRIMKTSSAAAEGEESAEKGGSNGVQGTQGSSAGADNGEELTKEQQIVAKYLKEMYTLKAYYIGELGAFERDLKSQYKSTYGTDKNAAAIAKVVQNNMGRVISLESECDKKVDGILANMKSELEAIGADTSIVTVVEDSYVNEKSLRKSYYLSLYN